MPRTHPPYPEEFKRQMVELVWDGRSAASLAREFEPSAGSIRSWVKQAEREDGRQDDGSTTEETEELTRLRRENRRLRRELEILKKATAWFARETNSIPPKSSSS